MNKYSVYLFVSEILHMHIRDANNSVLQYNCYYYFILSPLKIIITFLGVSTLASTVMNERGSNSSYCNTLCSS